MPALRTRRAVVGAMVLVAVLGPAPAVATSASATAIASSCLPADTDRPVVLAAEMGASEIDVSGGPVTVPVRARVVDTGGSGLASVMMTIGSLAGPGFTRWSPGHEGASALLVPEGDDWWSGSITVGQWDGYLSPWGVLQVSVWDRDGNYGQASTNDFRRADGSVPTLTIAPHPYDREQPYLSDLVMGRVAVDVRQHDALVEQACVVQATTRLEHFDLQIRVMALGDLLQGLGDVKRLAGALARGDQQTMLARTIPVPKAEQPKAKKGEHHGSKAARTHGPFRPATATLPIFAKGFRSLP